MAAPNVNGRLHLTGVHQKPPAYFLILLPLFLYKTSPALGDRLRMRRGKYELFKIIMQTINAWNKKLLWKKNGKSIII